MAVVPMNAMARRVLFPLLLLLAAFVVSARTLPLPPHLIGLDTEIGEEMLAESRARRAFLPLAMHFETQRNQAYCGVASMVMVLNATKVNAPTVPEYRPFATFTQDNVLDERTEEILPQETLRKKGMTLTQLGLLLQRHGLEAVVHHADDDGFEAFKTRAARQLTVSDAHVLVNYLRRTIGQESGGHISPLAAYDEVTERFLVLDVSRYKYPPVWVKAGDLYAAMNTTDSDNEGRRRGYVLVSRAPR